MLRIVLMTAGLAWLCAGCTTVEKRAARFHNLSCEQLGVALDYERKAERKARNAGHVTGIASIFESGKDEDALSLDSDANYIEADDHRTSVKAIRLEQRQRC